jgi:hypothetical protein
MRARALSFWEDGGQIGGQESRVSDRSKGTKGGRSGEIRTHSLVGSIDPSEARGRPEGVSEERLGLNGRRRGKEVDEG